MLTAIISGLFAFLGALIALYAQRKTQQENWLLQKRAEVFTNFLITLEESQTKAIELNRNNWNGLTGMDKMHLVVEAYEPTFIQSKIVLLFLSVKSKPVFDEFLNNILYHDYTNLSKMHPRDTIDKISSLFEHELKNLKL